VVGRGGKGTTSMTRCASIVVVGWGEDLVRRGKGYKVCAEVRSRIAESKSMAIG
jgi:hypothetical protein